MPKPVHLRRLAADDVDAALEHYLSAAGPVSAARFVDAVGRGLAHIGRHPHNGSLRFSYDLDVPDLSAWPLSRSPYFVFYVEHQNEIDVWRILHTRRDIPTELADS